MSKWVSLMYCHFLSDPEGTEDWWVRFDACDRTVARFMQTMPPVNLARNVEELACLVLVHSKPNSTENYVHRN